MTSQTRQRIIGVTVVIPMLALIFAVVWFMSPPRKPMREAIGNTDQPSTNPATNPIVPPIGVNNLVMLDGKPALKAFDRVRAPLQTISALSFDAKEGARENFDHLGYFDPATWLRYNKIDFGAGVATITVDVSCGAQFPGRILYFHLDGQDGPVIAQVEIPATDGFEAISAPVHDATGIHDLFITCTDGGFNLRAFKFIKPQKAIDLIPATSYSYYQGTMESRPGVVGHTDDGDWLKYDQIDFATGLTFVAVDLAMGPHDAKIEFHLDKPDGPMIGALIPIPTGNWSTFQIQETPIKDAAGVHDLFLTFHGGKGLPDIRTIQFK